MLDYAKTKAEKGGVANIAFHHDGFLTFEHDGPPTDFITSTFAFYHLPDFWKGIALKRMFKMLRPGGRFFIHDAIIEEDNAIGNIEALVEKLGEAGGNFMREDAEDHFRKEFSTYDWIMDGLLTRTGFEIDSKEIEDGVIATYYCTKSG